MKAPSLRRKLLTSMLTTSTSVLLLTGIALISYEFTSYKQTTARNLSTLAQSIAANSAGALAFEDDKVAKEILGGFRFEPATIGACLFDLSGKPYATWSANESKPYAPATAGPEGVRFTDRRITVVQPVTQAGARIGTLLVEQNLAAMYARVTTYAVVVFLVVSASAAVAFLLSSFFEKRIAQPILSLASTARTVSEKRDFSLRAAETTADELGLLTRDFNGMLAEVQRSERELTNELTARKKAETDLRESEERFRTLADNIVQLAWTADKDGTGTWFNQRCYAYTGATFDQLKERRGWEQLIHPDHRERVRAKFDAALQHNEVWEDIFLLRSKDGQYRWFLSRAIPIADQAGAIVRWFGTNTDIDEQKRSEHRLEQAVAERTAELRAANENLQTFSSTAAHDLRSPLRSIRSFSTAIVEDFGSQLDPQAKEYLDRIVSSAEKMQALLSDLLEYSRISQAELQLEPVSLKAATQTALSLLDDEIQARNAKVTVIDPLPTVLGHPATVVLLIQNLVSNALKFVSPGVQPQIRVFADEGKLDSPREKTMNGSLAQNAAAPPSAVSTLTLSNAVNTLPPDFLRLSVEDNGIGIGDKDAQKLFAAFKRLHNSQDYSGTGLGLAIVRKGAERLGGRVGMESQPGKGSRFWIELAKATF